MTSIPVNWKAASLQVSLFTRSPIPRSTDIYSAIVGSSPDSHEDRAKESVVRQTGMIGEDLFQVGFNPIRVDIVLAPPEHEASLGGALNLRFSMGAFSKKT